MTKSIEALITDLKAAAQEEIMLREAGDTSDKWQDEASPENVLLLIAVLESNHNEHALDMVNSPEIPEGWKLVPNMPTLGMLSVLGLTGSFDSMLGRYADMLYAAPEKPL